MTEFAKVADIKAGDYITVDDSFSCLTEGKQYMVYTSLKGHLCVKCNHSLWSDHILDGQISDDGIYYVGMFKCEAPMPEGAEEFAIMSANGKFWGLGKGLTVLRYQEASTFPTQEDAKEFIDLKLSKIGEDSTVINNINRNLWLNAKIVKISTTLTVL